MTLTKWMNFWKSFKGRGGVIFNPKICCRVWTFKQGYFGCFPKKIASWFSENEGGRGVKRHWELFRKFIRFGSLAPSLAPSRTYGRTLRWSFVLFGNQQKFSCTTQVASRWGWTLRMQQECKDDSCSQPGTLVAVQDSSISDLGPDSVLFWFQRLQRSAELW